MRKVAIFTGNRAEYGLLRPVIQALADDSSFNVDLVISGSHLSGMFGETSVEIEKNNLSGVYEIPLPCNNNSGRIDVHDGFAQIVVKGNDLLQKMDPDFLLIAGDRHETFAMAVSAFYNAIPIAHIFGGDLSQGGHLDDSARHSITKLAQLHFATNRDSFDRILGLGEEPWRVFNVGSTAVDSIVSAEYAQPDEVCQELSLELTEPVILFTQHPVTTEVAGAYEQVKESLEALKSLGYQTVITYPCSDPGGEAIIRAIHEYADCPHFRIRKSLGWRLYLGCMNVAACVIGNSSSGLMETPSFKVPCVNIGYRQAGRLRAENVIDAPYDREKIMDAINKALFDEQFLAQTSSCSTPYGDGRAAPRIVDVLKSISLGRKLRQKQMTF